MDANKLKVLREVGYKVRQSCETCIHSDLSPDGWGYCNKHRYEHLKHSEKQSRLSIHRSGCCTSYQKNEISLALLALHAFSEFVE